MYQTEKDRVDIGLLWTDSKVESLGLAVLASLGEGNDIQ